jgi:hypothetical protein
MNWLYPLAPLERSTRPARRSGGSLPSRTPALPVTQCYWIHPNILGVPDDSQERAVRKRECQFFWITQSPPAAFNPVHNFAAFSPTPAGIYYRALVGPFVSRRRSGHRGNCCLRDYKSAEKSDLADCRDRLQATSCSPLIRHVGIIPIPQLTAAV